MVEGNAFTAGKLDVIQQRRGRSSSSGSEWLLPASLILLTLVPAAAGVARLTQLASVSSVTSENARFFAQPLPVVLHILAVIPFSVIGAFQFAPAFRARHRRGHRAAGKAVGACGLVASLTGLWMTQFYPWPVGDGTSLYLLRLVFGTAMTLSIVFALLAVRRRDFSAHGAWMIRGYAIGMGAGTQVLTHVPWVILIGKPGESARTFLMGAGWIINLMVAEWILHRRRRIVVDSRA